MIYFPEKNDIVELQVGMSTGTFTTSGQELVYCQIKTEEIQVKKKKPGRKKDTKNRPKEVIEKEKEEKTKKQKKRKSRSIFKTGKISSVAHDIETNEFNFDSSFNPEIHTMFFFLLNTLFLTFKGNHITSNYVENFSSQFKFFLNRRCRNSILNFLEDFQV